MRLVHVVEGGERAQMSKRSGDFVSLDELLDDIGVDAARWFMLWRSHDTTVDLDLELARRESSDNPVYYVQYAHARIASILRKAGVEGDVGGGGGSRHAGHAPRAEREGAGQAPARASRGGPGGGRAPGPAPDLRLLDRRRRRLPRLLPRLPGDRRRGRGCRGRAPGALPADQAHDRRLSRAARNLRPGADVNDARRDPRPLLPRRAGRGTLRRRDLEVFGAILADHGRGALLVTGAGDGPLALSTGLASAAAARGTRTALLECDLDRSHPGRRAGPGPGAGPPRVPARGGRGAGDPAAARPRRARLGRGDGTADLRRRRGAAGRRFRRPRSGRLRPRAGEAPPRLRAGRPPRPAARRREWRPAGGRHRRRRRPRLRRPAARRGARRPQADEGAASGFPRGRRA